MQNLWKAYFKSVLMAFVMLVALVLSACGQTSQSTAQELPENIANAVEEAGSNETQSLVANTMRLVAYEGDITIKNLTGSEISPTENMKLQNGYTVSTAAASYAFISLDDEKAIKLDGLTEFSVRQKGEQLEVLLLAGQLYFNVSAPLSESEVMNIRTSNMVTGIRGTSGFLSANWNGQIEQQASALLMGEADVFVREITGEITEHSLSGGFIEYYRPFGDVQGQVLQILPLIEDGQIHIPAFVIAQILENPEELQTLAENLNVSEEELTQQLQAVLQEKLTQEEAEQTQREAQAVQQRPLDVNQMFEEAGTSGEQNQNGGTNNAASQEAATTPSVNVSTSTPSSASSSSAPTSVPALTPEPDPSVSTLSGNVTVEQVVTELNKSTIQTVVLSNATLTNGGDVAVPSGKTLKTQNQVNFSGDIEMTGDGTFLVDGGSLSTGTNELSMETLSASVVSGSALNSGTLKIKNLTFTNSGSITANDLVLEENAHFENAANVSLTADSDALKVAESTQLTNRGVITMANVPFTQRAVENKGTLLNEAGASLSSPGQLLITGSTAVSTNSGSMAVGAASVDDTAARFTNTGTLSFNPADINEPALAVKGTFETTTPLSNTVPIKVEINDINAGLSASTVTQILATNNCVLVDEAGGHPAANSLTTIDLDGKPVSASTVEEVVTYAGANTARPTINVIAANASILEGFTVTGTVNISGNGNEISLGTSAITVQSGANLTLDDVGIVGTATVLRLEDTSTTNVTGNTKIEKSGTTDGSYAVQMNAGFATLNYTQDGTNRYIKAVGAERVMGDLAGNVNTTAQALAINYGVGGYMVLTTW